MRPHNRGPIARTIDRFLFVVLKYLSKSRSRGSLLLVAYTDEQLDRIDESLGLIERVQPIRFRQIVRDLRCVWVRGLSGKRGEYNHTVRACSIAESAFEGHYNRPEEIALIIIHEATHARLTRLGIDYDEAIRSRVEAICHRRELSFAKLLGDDQAIYVAGYYLANPVDYSDEAMDSRSEAAILADARDIGFPLWIVRYVFRAKRRRDQRLRRG